MSPPQQILPVYSNKTGQLRINHPNGKNKIVNICGTEAELANVTVGQLKEEICQQLKIPEDFRMVYSTEALEETSTLGHYGIRHMCVIQTLYSLPGGL